MNFGLLLSHLPRVDESRAHYDAMLHMREHHRETRLVVLWRYLRHAIFR